MSEYSYCPKSTYELVDEGNRRTYGSPYCEKIILENKEERTTEEQKS